MGIEKYKLSMTSPEVDAALQRAAAGGALDQQLQRKVNPNLLDNWYFGDPVNTQGKTEYVGSAAYAIDRWWLQYDTNIALIDGGIKLSGKWQMIQYLKKKFPNTIYTASIFYKDKVGTDSLFLSVRTDDTPVGSFNASEASGLVSTTFSAADFNSVVVGFYGASDNTATIIAIKLELGDQQTLAHQGADGNWVLNEIPNKAEQLAICSQYAPGTGELLGGWEHPPMQLGVEYRTTERYLGKPVYVKLVDCGKIVEGKSVDLGLDNPAIIISVDAVVNNAPSPSFYTASGLGAYGHSYYVDYYNAAPRTGSITFHVGNSLNSNQPQGYVKVKYTKTTD